METIIERLDKYRNYLNYTDNKFQSVCGISNGVLAQARKNNGSLSRSTMEKIYSTFAELNRLWVETGKGEMILAPTIQNTNSQVIGSHNTGSTVKVENNGSQQEINAMLSMLQEQQRQNAETQRQNAKLQNMMERFLTIIETKNE